MRILAAIAALCAFVSAYLILVIDRHHERIGDPRRASRRTVMGFRIIGIAGLVLLAWSLDRPMPGRRPIRPRSSVGIGTRRGRRRAQALRMWSTPSGPSAGHGISIRPASARLCVGSSGGMTLHRARASAPAGAPARGAGGGSGITSGCPFATYGSPGTGHQVGTPAHGPAPGVIVVWAHHVGIIVGRHASGWIVKSGNDGNRVRERPRSVSGAIAFRRV
jgi:hypothetical protein